MRALLNFIIRQKHVFLFILLEVLSLTLLFSRNGYQKYVCLTTANDVVGFSYNVISGITSYLNLKEENRLLEAQNERLRIQLHQCQRQRQTSQGAEAPTWAGTYSVVAAQVVNMTSHKAHNLITINKGEADGIRPEMGVICSQGVVGIVYMTSRHYSIVLPIINENSKISCRLHRTQHFGTLTWKRGPATHALLSGIPRHATISKRDTVETNGYSDIFPPGLPVGTASKAGDSDDGLSHLLQVRLFTQFSTLREVSVICDYQSEERRLLEEQAEDGSEQPGQYGKKSDQ